MSKEKIEIQNSCNIVKVVKKILDFNKHSQEGHKNKNTNTKPNA